jgi:hypothetical protein
MEGMIEKIITWSFLGAFAVLVLTKAQGFNTAVSTVVQPIEQETTLIATAGASGTSTAVKKGK